MTWCVRCCDVSIGYSYSPHPPRSYCPGRGCSLITRRQWPSVPCLVPWRRVTEWCWTWTMSQCPHQEQCLQQTCYRCFAMIERSRSRLSHFKNLSRFSPTGTFEELCHPFGPIPISGDDHLFTKSFMIVFKVCILSNIVKHHSHVWSQVCLCPRNNKSSVRCGRKVHALVTANTGAMIREIKHIGTKTTASQRKFISFPIAHCHWG